MEKSYFYGIYGIRFVYHGAWNDPEIIWHGHTFNYYDVENTLWKIWKSEPEYSTANLSTMISTDDAFSAWIKKNRKRVKEFLQHLIDTEEE